MHRLAAHQHQHDAGFARAYALGLCVMPTIPTAVSRTIAPIFWANVTGSKRRPRPLIFSP